MKKLANESHMSDEQPDILLLIADQFRGDCLSSDGHPAVMTPNLDDLAQTGTRFRRAYSTCPSCIPSRMSLMTGLHPENNGLVAMTSGHPIKTPTMPAVMRDGGYQTALIGRIMHQYPESARYGFETMLTTYFNKPDDIYGRDLRQATGGWGDVKGGGISNNGWGARSWHLPEPLHPTSWVVRKMREFTREADETCPLFLTGCFQGPHPPLIPPAFYLDRYLRMELPEPAIGAWAGKPPAHTGLESSRVHLKGEALRYAQAGYYGMINQIDDEIYWLINEFKQRSLKRGRNWVIVFTSDHGEMMGDHYFFRKCLPYEGSARIPFLIGASPGLGFVRAAVNSQPVCLEDLFPTFAELGEIDCPDVDGRSLVPILRGETQQTRKLLHGEHATQYSPQQANHYLTDGRYKYIWFPITGMEQLFDLEQDSAECRNVLEEQEDIAAHFRREMVECLHNRPEGFVQDNRLVAVESCPSWIGRDWRKDF